MKFLSDERAVLAEDVSRTTARVEHLEQQLLQAAMDSKRLEGELADAKTHINSLNSDRVTSLYSYPSQVENVMYCVYTCQLTYHAQVPRSLSSLCWHLEGDSHTLCAGKGG